MDPGVCQDGAIRRFVVELVRVGVAGTKGTTRRPGSFFHITSCLLAKYINSFQNEVGRVNHTE